MGKCGFPYKTFWVDSISIVCDWSRPSFRPSAMSAAPFSHFFRLLFTTCLRSGFLDIKMRPERDLSVIVVFLSCV